MRLAKELILILFLLIIIILLTKIICDGKEAEIIQETYIEITVDDSIQKQYELEHREILDKTYRISQQTPILATIATERIEYTKEELNTLEMLVQHEAGAESYKCKLLVASVIINRVTDDRYPDNLNDVIYEAPIYNGKKVYQFSPTIEGLYKEPDNETKLAVKKALSKDYAEKAWMFNNKSITDSEKQQWFDQFEIVAEVDDVQFRK